MKKRDLIREIEGIKANLIAGSRHNQAFTSWIDVLDALAAVEHLPSDSTLKQSVTRYAPIRGVALLEGYFRLLVKDLIDHGPPFSINAQEFREIKFTILEINAIRHQRVTAGEFIAHLLPMNNLSDINSHMTILLGQDFINLVQCSISAGRREGNQILPDTRTFREIFPDMMRDLTTIFEVRHVLCHELATSYKLDIENIFNISSTVINFINVVDYLMRQMMESSTSVHEGSATH